MLPAAHWMSDSAETELSGLNDASGNFLNNESFAIVSVFKLQH